VQQAAQRIRECEQERRVLFYAVGVRGANMARLRQIVTREPIDMRQKSFHKVIEFLSAGVAMIAQGRLDEEGPLPMEG